jgi:hypothetical protein
VITTSKNGERVMRKMQRNPRSRRHTSSAGLEASNGGMGGLRATRVPRRGRKSDAGLNRYSTGGGE